LVHDLLTFLLDVDPTESGETNHARHEEEVRDDVQMCGPIGKPVVLIWHISGSIFVIKEITLAATR
jgi:hypothetical protein